MKYVAFHLHCPKCKVLIHPTDPLVNIRFILMFPDSTVEHVYVTAGICFFVV